MPFANAVKVNGVERARLRAVGRPGVLGGPRARPKVPAVAAGSVAAAREARPTRSARLIAGDHLEDAADVTSGTKRFTSTGNGRFVLRRKYPADLLVADGREQ